MAMRILITVVALFGLLSFVGCTDIDKFSFPCVDNTECLSGYVCVDPIEPGQGSTNLRCVSELSLGEPFEGPEVEELEGWSVIPAGTFTQGSPTNETGRFPDEGPQREVTITRTFYLQQTAVTQAQWEGVMGNNPSNFQSGSNEDRPVENVSWWDAIAYMNALSAQEGFKECYVVSGCDGTPGGGGYLCESIIFVGLDCEGYRLPTEAEWEYAARAGTTEMTYGGDHHGRRTCDPSLVLSSVAWWCGTAGSTTHPVGQKDPNPWGLYDMIGNVWEWASDSYENIAYETGSIDDPISLSSGSSADLLPVFRGCSWGTQAQFCRAAIRNGDDPDFRSNQLGFRAARTP